MPRGDHLEIEFVAPGSPAARAGWRVGQHIKTVDGQPIGADYVAKQSDWPFRAAGSIVVLTGDDGVPRPLTLADYY